MYLITIIFIDIKHKLYYKVITLELKKHYDKGKPWVIRVRKVKGLYKFKIIKTALLPKNVHNFKAKIQPYCGDILHKYLLDKAFFIFTSSKKAFDIAHNYV